MSITLSTIVFSSCIVSGCVAVLVSISNGPPDTSETRLSIQSRKHSTADDPSAEITKPDLQLRTARSASCQFGAFPRHIRYNNVTPA